MKALPDIIVQGYEPGAVILLSQPDACRAMFEVSVTTSRSALKHYPQSNLQIPDDCEYTLIIAQKRLVEAIMAVRGGTTALAAYASGALPMAATVMALPGPINFQIEKPVRTGA